jgi:hypothetical protein
MIMVVATNFLNKIQYLLLLILSLLVIMGDFLTESIVVAYYGFTSICELEISHGCVAK